MPTRASRSSTRRVGFCHEHRDRRYRGGHRQRDLRQRRMGHLDRQEPGPPAPSCRGTRSARTPRARPASPMAPASASTAARSRTTPSGAPRPPRPTSSPTTADARGSGSKSTAGNGNAILRNAIYSNGSIGIDLNNNGVTANDAGDARRRPERPPELPPPHRGLPLRGHPDRELQARRPRRRLPDRVLQEPVRGGYVPDQASARARSSQPRAT